MAAGLGFKDFTTGEVLTAADVDGYLMQGVLVFASSAARDAAITSPQEGQFAFLKDTNTTMYYTGSAWTNLDTTGMVNPMTTTGDTIYSSSGSTPDRLGIGSTGQVLTVAGGLPSWATPASGGGMTVIGETAASALSSLTFSGFGSYKQLLLMWAGIKHSGSGSVFGLRFNNNSSADTYAGNGILNFSTDDRFRANSLINGTGSGDVAPFGTNASAAGKETQCYGYVLIDNVSSSTKSKSFEFSYGFFNSASATTKGFTGQGAFFSTTAITTVDIVRLSGSDTFTNQNDTTIRLLGIS